jgi:hypothetical protein
MNIAGEQQLPEPPSLDERRALMVNLRTFGSTGIGDAYDEFVNSMDEFHALKWILSTTSEIPVPDQAWNELEVLRSKALADLAKVERLVSDELASL